jgi:hypothetical protein
MGAGTTKPRFKRRPLSVVPDTDFTKRSQIGWIIVGAGVRKLGDAHQWTTTTTKSIYT